MTPLDAPLTTLKPAPWATAAPCTQAYKWGEVYRIVRDLRAQEKPFRKIALEDFGGRVTHGVIQRIAAGQEPQSPKIREALGLPAYQSVVVVTGESIPPGAQVIGALVCDCGMPFIPNSPNRKHCFICRPFKRRKS